MPDPSLPHVVAFAVPPFACERPIALIAGVEGSRVGVLAGGLAWFDATTGERVGWQADQQMRQIAEEIPVAGAVAGGGTSGVFAMSANHLSGVNLDAVTLEPRKGVPRSPETFGRIGSVAVTNDGFARASWARGASSVHLWRSVVSTYEGAGPVAFSPDGSLLWAGDGLYDVGLGHRLLRYSAFDTRDAACAVVFSPDGSRVGIGTGLGRVEVWSLHPWQRLSSDVVVSDPMDRFPVECVGFSSDGAKLVAFAMGRYAAWEMRSGLLSRGAFDAAGVAVDRDGWRLFGMDRHRTVLRALDLETGRALPHDGHTAPVRAVAISSARAVSGDVAGHIRVWDLSTRETIARVSAPGEVRRVGFSPDGETVIAEGVDDHERPWERAYDVASAAEREGSGLSLPVDRSSGGARLASRHGLTVELHPNALAFDEAFVRDRDGVERALQQSLLATRIACLSPDEASAAVLVQGGVHIYDLRVDAYPLMVSFMRGIGTPDRASAAAYSSDGGALIVGSEAGGVYHVTLPR